MGNKPTQNVETFLAALERAGRKPATVAAYRRALSAFFVYAEEAGVNAPEQVGVDLLLEYKCSRLDSRYTAASVRRHVHRILTFYDWLVGISTE